MSNEQEATSNEEKENNKQQATSEKFHLHKLLVPHTRNT